MLGAIFSILLATWLQGGAEAQCGIDAGTVYCAEVDVCFTTEIPFHYLPIPNCPATIAASFHLYTRSNPDTPQAVTRTTLPPAWMFGKRTHYLVHGWLGSGNDGYLHRMKDNLLLQGDYNVIIVGWQKGSRNILYPQSASDTRAVGADIATVSNMMVQTQGADPASFYCAGHSLGSHVCGHAGNTARDHYGWTWGRITGLDPAGPLFENNEDWNIGLNPTSAAYVDVIHTNGEENIIMNLGTMRILGHADFYPNGGGRQPECILDPLDPLLNPILEDLEYPLSMPSLVPACSHMRALTYYEESILSHCYARYTCTDQMNLPGSCVYSDTPVQEMGFFADTHQARGIFYLETNGARPFCQG